MATPERYNRKPAAVDAIQYTGTLPNVVEILTWAAGKGQFTHHVNLAQSVLIVGTSNGNKTVAVGDWVVKDAANGFDVVTNAALARDFEKEGV